MIESSYADDRGRGGKLFSIFFFWQRARATSPPVITGCDLEMMEFVTGAKREGEESSICNVLQCVAVCYSVL